MITLGITGRRRQAASALAVDGRIVAAVTEASLTRVANTGYRDAGFPVASATTCLRVAGIGADAVEHIVTVGRGVRAEAGRVELGTEALPAGWREPLERAGLGSLLKASVSRVGRATAHAWQSVATAPGPGLVLTADVAGSASLFALREGTPAFVRDLPGVACAATVAMTVAQRLGWTGDEVASPVEFLELLAATAVGPSEPRFSTALSAPDIDAAAIVAAALREIDDVEAQVGGSLRDVGSLKVAVQRARAAMAEAVLARMATVLSDLIGRWRSRARLEPVMVAGDLFSSAAFIDRLRARCGPALAPVAVPEAVGGVLGAALACHDPLATRPLSNLALGPTFTEAEAKGALENARLDYLYEPRWDRLLTRVSGLLSRGKVVGWFHGAAEFGPRSLGGRSVLADPSDRYVRENINRFLKQGEESATLAVSLLAESAAECLADGAASPWMLARATVRSAFRARMRAALDASDRLTYHTADEGHQPGLADLLRVHQERTGVPGLVNTTLAGPGEPTACSPRDAVRTFFSSAIDALVLHRFLLMKDYWQMRSEGE